MAGLQTLLSLPKPLSTLVLLISASARVSVALQTVDDSKCDCYLTNGSVVSYFDNHYFFDFRSLSQYQGVPAVISSESGSANAYATSSYFTTSAWNDVWEVQSWNNSASVGKDATVLMINSPNNIYIEQNTEPNPSPATWMTLRTVRMPNFQSAAEIESVSLGYQYLSMRMLARTLGSPGGVTAMFTYRGGNGSLADVQESDLEVRTKDPDSVVQYTNQPSYNSAGEVVPQATRNVSLPDGLTWGDWAVHRLDWTPGLSTWYVDGQEVANISFQAPKNPGQVILNAWSDGGEWTGNMSVGGAAYLQVQWFEIVFNTTDSSSSSKKKGKRGDSSGICEAVCSIDETTTPGSPVMLWDNAAGRLLGGGLMAWVLWGICLVLLLESWPV